MRVMAAAVTAASVLAAAVMPAATAAGADDAEVERIVRQHVQPMLIAAGGMAVVVHIDDRTLFFNYGMADVARKEPITSDVLFNLASVTKVFISTLLAQAVKQGEVALDDPVAKYVTELQQGATSARSRSPSSRATPRASPARRSNTSPGIAGRTSFPTSSAISIPGKRTTRISRASRRSIPTAPSSCSRSRCSGASTRRSPSSWTRACLRRWE